MNRFLVIIFPFFIRKFLKTQKFFQKILEQFHPPPPTTTERKKIRIFQPPPPVASKLFHNHRGATKKIENFQPSPPRKASAYTSTYEYLSKQ
jgi:hypothetical protein